MKLPLSVCLLASALLAALPVNTHGESAALDAAFKHLQTYDWTHSREPLAPISAAAQSATNHPALEKRLADLLNSSAPRAAKDVACRELSLIGTAQAVPALARLLSDEELSHMARFALERINDPSASAALRQALPLLAGGLQIGVVESLGHLKDAPAAPVLAQLLDKNHDNNSAVVLALGRIGTLESERALKKFEGAASETERILVTAARLMAAENLTAVGQATIASNIFHEIYSAPHAGPLRFASLSGLLSVSGADKAEMLLATLLRTTDRQAQTLAAEWLSANPANPVIEALLQRFQSFPDGGQIVLLQLLRNRSHPLAADIARKALRSENVHVRVAALRAIAAAGDTDDVQTLLQISVMPESEETKAARFALANLPGAAVDKKLAERLEAADGAVAVVLLQTLAARHSREGHQAIVSKLNSPGEGQRAALQALASLGDQHHIPALIPLLTDSRTETREQAEMALESIVTRTRVASLGALEESWETADADVRGVLIRQFGIIHGPRALQAVRRGLKDSDAAVRAAAFRVLVEWPGAGALADLVALAKDAEEPGWKPLAFRGLVRLCRDGDMPQVQRLNGLAQAADLAAGRDEKLLVISGLASVPAIASLKRLEKYLDDPEVSQPAAVSIVALAGKLPPASSPEVVPVLRKIRDKTQEQSIKDSAAALIAKLENKS